MEQPLNPHGCFEKAKIPQWAINKGAHRIEYIAFKDPNSNNYDLKHLVIRGSGNDKGEVDKSFTEDEKDRLRKELGLGVRKK